MANESIYPFTLSFLTPENLKRYLRWKSSESRVAHLVLLLIPIALQFACDLGGNPLIGSVETGDWAETTVA